MTVMINILLRVSEGVLCNLYTRTGRAKEEAEERCISLNVRDD